MTTPSAVVTMTIPLIMRPPAEGEGGEAGPVAGGGMVLLGKGKPLQEGVCGRDGGGTACMCRGCVVDTDIER